MRPLIAPLARAAAVAAALALAGCAAQPIGTFDAATTTRIGGEIQRDLYFRPGAPTLLPGQAEEANGLLRSLVLRAEDDVIMTFGSTGSDRLNALRGAELRRAITAGPARLRIMGPLGFAQSADSPDVVLLQVRRYDRALVTCPPLAGANEAPDFLTPIPALGCANAANLANQAADLRDLTAPRVLDGSDAALAAAAVQRYRTGQVKVRPLDSVAGN